MQSLLQLLMSFKSWKKLALGLDDKPQELGQEALSNIKQTQKQTWLLITLAVAGNSSSKTRIPGAWVSVSQCEGPCLLLKNWPFTHLLTSALSLILLKFEKTHSKLPSALIKQPSSWEGWPSLKRGHLANSRKVKIKHNGKNNLIIKANYKERKRLFPP